MLDRAKEMASAIFSRVKRAPAKLPAGGGVQYAGFWRRYLAFLIDMILSLVLGTSAIAVVGLALPPSVSQSPLVVGLLMLAMQGGYFILLDASSYKGTVGKRLLKLRVTDLKGQRLSRLQAAARTGAKAMSAATFGVGFVLIATTRKKQGLHDKVAKCLVLRKANEPLSKFIPAAFEFPLVLVASLVATALILMQGLNASAPHFARMNAQMTVLVSIRAMEPAQQLIAAALAAERPAPTTLARELMSPAALPGGTRTVYDNRTGSLTVNFVSAPLAGQAFVLSPEFRVKGQAVTWRCSTINMPAYVVPPICGVR